MWTSQAAVAQPAPGWAGVNDELCLDFAVSAGVAEKYAQGFRGKGLAHVAGGLVEGGQTAVGRVEEAVPVRAVQALSWEAEASSGLEHTESVVVVLEQGLRTLGIESGHASPLPLLPDSELSVSEHYFGPC